MAYEILNRFIPSSKYPLKAPYSMVPETITIHNTWNDATATGEVSYMAGNANPTSFHVAIDDKYAVQAIPFSRNAWHAGDGQGKGNRKSIGIEICYSKSGGTKYAAAEENAIEYVAHVLHDKGWGIDRVKWHRDWSGKNCPHRILDEGRATSVLNRIAAKLQELKNPAPIPVAKPVFKPAAPIKQEEETIVAEQYKKDAQPSKSLAPEFKEAVKAGITDGTYPHRPVTREEAAVMAYRASKK